VESKLAKIIALTAILAVVGIGIYILNARYQQIENQMKLEQATGTKT